MNLLHKVLLNSIPEVGPVRAARLLEHFGEAEKVFSADLNELKLVEGMSESAAESVLKGARRREEAEREIKKAETAGIRLLCIDDPEYPPLLKTLPDPPFILYCKGKPEVLSHISIALVGSRKAGHYGQKMARILSQELAIYGITTVSGLARGIDTVVHESTLQADGQTIAILGSGLLDIYPPENRKLAEKVSVTGAVISEFPLETGPQPYHFPRRNRLIAGLSLGTVVVEADEKSGALITARLATEQGREVFAVPGPATSDLSRGPHRLIRDGAKLVQCCQDILEEIRPYHAIAEPCRTDLSPTDDSRRSFDPSSDEAQLLKLIQDEPIHIDRLKTSSKLSTSVFSKVLLDLELKGAIQSLPGKMYART